MSLATLRPARSIGLGLHAAFAGELRAKYETWYDPQARRMAYGLGQFARSSSSPFQNCRLPPAIDGRNSILPAGSGPGRAQESARSPRCVKPVGTPLTYIRRWRIVTAVIFLETPVFTCQIKELINDEQYRLLQLHLVADPVAGDLIPGSGGLRKIRIGAAGRGKRGGARVIYYWLTQKSQIYMLLAYAKNEQDDLTPEQLKALRALVKQEFD